MGPGQAPPKASISQQEHRYGLQALASRPLLLALFARERAPSTRRSLLWLRGGEQRVPTTARRQRRPVLDAAPAAALARCAGGRDSCRRLAHGPVEKTSRERAKANACKRVSLDGSKEHQTLLSSPTTRADQNRSKGASRTKPWTWGMGHFLWGAAMPALFVGGPESHENDRCAKELLSCGGALADELSVAELAEAAHTARRSLRLETKAG